MVLSTSRIDEIENEIIFYLMNNDPTIAKLMVDVVKAHDEFVKQRDIIFAKILTGYNITPQELVVRMSPGRYDEVILFMHEEMEKMTQEIEDRFDSDIDWEDDEVYVATYYNLFTISFDGADVVVEADDFLNNIMRTAIERGHDAKH